MQLFERNYIMRNAPELIHHKLGKRFKLMQNCETCKQPNIETKLCDDCQVEHEQNLVDAQAEIVTCDELYHWGKI